MKRRAVLLLVALLIFSACGVFRVVKGPEPAPSGPLKTMKFESGNPGDEIPGWRTTSYVTSSGEKGQDEYKAEYTDKDKRSGEMSLLLRPRGKVKDAKDKQNTAGFCGDHPYPGSPLLVSAYLKGDGGVVWLGANPNKRGGGVAGIQSSFRRSREWAKVTLISPPVASPAEGVPTQHPLTICLVLGMVGGQRAWLDDVTFSKVDLANLPPEKAQAIPVENIDMERFDRAGSLAGWTLASYAPTGEVPPGFELRADRKVKRSGAASLLLTTDVPVEKPPGVRADYCLDHQPLLGKMVRVAGWVKTDAGEGSATMGLVALSFSQEEELAMVWSGNLPPVGAEAERSSHIFDESFDWTRHELVIAVPKSAKSLCISVGLDQVGSVWADDLSVEVIEL